MSTDKKPQAVELDEGQLDAAVGGTIGAVSPPDPVRTVASEPPDPSRTVTGAPPDPVRTLTTRTL